MIAQRGPDLIEYDCCDYCHELPDGTEQYVAWGETGVNLLLHPACQQRILDRWKAIGDLVCDIDGNPIDVTLWSPSERSNRS